MDFFTLHALAAEWDAALRGARLTDVWTQSRNEVSLAVDGPDGAWTLRVLCDPALPLLFRAEGGGRQRRNTADVFPDLPGRTVAAVHTADRDRHVFVDFEDGSILQVLLFGSRPNVLWVEEGGVREAFLRGAEWEGEPAPEPRPAPDPATEEAVAGRWRPDRPSLAQAVRAAAPLLPPALAADAVRTAGLEPDGPPPKAPPSALVAAVVALRQRLGRPSPTVVWRGDLAEALLPVPLEHPPDGWRTEPFESADAAVRVYARRALGQRRFRTLYAPTESALARAHARRQRSVEAMLDELAQPSRADRYETWGHLLMAQAAVEGPGREEAVLPDIVAGTGEPVTIPLDPALSAVENAQRYYDKARRTRRAREEAEARWAAVQSDAEALTDLLGRLRALDRLPDLQAFLEAEKAAVDRFVRSGGDGEASEPFRRIALPGGYEALVGKHARGNAHLTTRVASPHDLWLHARGVPGSHVVIRRGSRTAEVPASAVEAAARLAAYFSEARRQPLAPVTVTERKHVRPVKGGPPGRVRVDRERVVDVVPGLPGV